MLRMHNDPALRAVCRELTVADAAYIDAVKTRMVSVCRRHKGAGLAASQIGELVRLILVWPDPIAHPQKYFFLVNPIIVSHAPEKTTADEGCLSYPGTRTGVERWNGVTVEHGLSVKFKSTYSGWTARIVQHEIDHTNGICRVGDAWRKPRGNR